MVGRNSKISSMDRPAYIRASKKQLSYLAYLCDELDVRNCSLYERYSMRRAEKEISRLSRRLAKLKAKVQLKLL